MKNVRFITHKGKKIIYTKILEGNIKLFEEALNEEKCLLDQIKGEGLILNNISLFVLDAEKVKVVKKFLPTVTPKLKRNALVGLSPILINLLNTFSKMFKVKFAAFDTEEEALEWLVS